MSILSKKMLFTYLLSEIDTSKYNKKELQKKVKVIHHNIFNKGKEKRKWKSIIQQSQLNLVEII